MPKEKAAPRFRSVSLQDGVDSHAVIEALFRAELEHEKARAHEYLIALAKASSVLDVGPTHTLTTMGASIGITVFVREFLITQPRNEPAALSGLAFATFCLIVFSFHWRKARSVRTEISKLLEHPASRDT